MHVCYYQFSKRTASAVHMREVRASKTVYAHVIQGKVASMLHRIFMHGGAKVHRWQSETVLISRDIDRHLGGHRVRISAFDDWLAGHDLIKHALLVAGGVKGKHVTCSMLAKLAKQQVQRERVSRSTVPALLYECGWSVLLAEQQLGAWLWCLSPWCSFTHVKLNDTHHVVFCKQNKVAQCASWTCIALKQQCRKELVLVAVVLWLRHKQSRTRHLGLTLQQSCRMRRRDSTSGPQQDHKRRKCGLYKICT